MTSILLCGANGKMGRAVDSIVTADNDAKIVAGIDLIDNGNSYPVYMSIYDVKENFDVIIDFSHPSVTDSILDYAKENNIPAVICTTGLSKEQISKIEFYSKEVPLFFSANMSIGINLLIDLVKRASRILEENFDIEIIEKHHNLKLDAPSGTALAIADGISEAVSFNPEYVYDRHSVRKKRDKAEIGIHSMRGGTIVGEHSVIFAGNNEVIEINHSATSKEVFAVGAVKAAKFMKGKPSGLYNMTQLIAES
ncbi:MAG: 4-hydroxy-tetrahydrodipicolinate reductase [Clostridia bacterium]|nr:4-hydroxy-tetrahydrodipicolinate reductase [Clostridia bacterium]